MTASKLSAPERAIRRVDGYLPIEDYAAIGDGRSIALVGRDGSVDWMCLPEMDSPSVFGALLDPVDGGSFSLAPAIPYSAHRRYVSRTNVLITDFRTEQGVVRVTDALTVDPAQTVPWRELVRKVQSISGQVPMQWRLHPRFDFGRLAVEPTSGDGALAWRHGELLVAFRSWDAGEAQISHGVARGEFLAADGHASLLALMASDEPALQIPKRAELERRLEETTRMWQRWVSNNSYEGPWNEAVERSLLAIRLLTREPGGAIAAAGTTSLPETIGGKRNFDYRFAWVRDLSFTTDALMRVGMRELAHDAVTWLLRAVGTTTPRVDPVYTLSGEVLRSQESLALPGYRGSAPVHVGNQAGSQLQLGGFGDLLETIWHYVNSGGLLAPGAAERLADTADLLCAIWQKQDAGLWELGDSAHYTTSKIGCWTALERIIDLAQRDQVPARHIDRWRAERERVREFIDSRLWSETRNSYLMKAGSEALDCGVLLASRRGFADPAGERMAGTIDAIRSELQADGPLLYRYSGMGDQENAFLACSFWMVEALALAGRGDQAAETMDAMVGLSNDVGLYSEEMEPGSHELRGNFPQGLSHLALISAAAITAAPDAAR
ncbi:MAG TPA: glycoside hydrolase family 15 protein [Solirubrobacteraceae bacterium]|nr:glycoside hydrolase family 15 protein [Solirubrobacteraceae bacterium]